MHYKVLLEAIRRRPFEPFLVTMSSGEKYLVDHPENMMVLKHALVIPVYEKHRLDVDERADRAVYASYLHIAALELVPSPETIWRPGPMLFTAIDHPAIACHDVRKLTDWYCTVLGMRVIGDNGKTPPALVIGYDADARGGAVLEMMPIRDPGPEPRDVPRFCKGLRHFALRVSDFDAAYEHLKKAGVAFLGEKVIAVGGGPIISFRDPEGNELQIVQR